MAKFDDQLNRMEYLMQYKMPVNENKVSGSIEYKTVGADGKVYGIVKEGTMYYIKTAEKGKENLSESYDYINGFNNRSENAFKSYNNATKHLELKLMALNESYGKDSDVSTVDFNRNEKMFGRLTESARHELNRVHEIMENLDIKDNIGDHGNPEGKGSSTGANTKKNNDPFDEIATASLDKDSIAKQSDPKTANDDYTSVNGIDSDLQSISMKTKNSGSQDDYHDVKDDLDGESVDYRKNGGKAVKMNEGKKDDEWKRRFDELFGGNPFSKDGCKELGLDADELYGGKQKIRKKKKAVDESEYGDVDMTYSDEDLIDGDNRTLTGEEDYDEDDAISWDKIDEEMEGNAEFDFVEPEDEEALDGPSGNGEALSWDKMNESIDRITKRVVGRVQLAEQVDALVKEEITKLNDWGRHPKYGKQPMTLPANTEVFRGSADRDWNDESAKGDHVYGKKIGSSAPFDVAVDELTDDVMSQMTDMLGVKKK